MQDLDGGVLEQVGIVEDEDGMPAILGGQLLDVLGNGTEQHRGRGRRGQAKAPAALAVEIRAPQGGVVEVVDLEATWVELGREPAHQTALADADDGAPSWPDRSARRAPATRLRASRLHLLT
jgi:hypothetical protein